MQIDTSSSNENVDSGVSTSDDIGAGEGRTSIDLLQKPDDALPQEEDFAKLVPGKKPGSLKIFWQRWYPAIKHILPVYIAIHAAIFVISCLAFLFTVPDFSAQIMPVSTLWRQWHYWDTSNFTHIALYGYATLRSMAFFPLYPLLERGLMPITGDPLIAGLLISNTFELVMFVVLYRLLEEDFNGDRAYHTLLYFAIFPTAFFLSAAYSESLFLCLSVLSFYQLRHGRWWLAGLFAALASLTRPDGMFLLAPFCYEYLRQIWQRAGAPPLSVFSRELIPTFLKGIRWNVLAALLFPGGVFLVIAYGYFRFHDPLAFVHAHDYWNRSLHFPGWNMLKAAWTILHHGFLNFLTLRTSIDLGADVLVLALILLSFVGPWKLPKNLWSYGMYAAVLYLYFQLFPKDGIYPLESMSRFLLEIFPAFLMLSRISKYRTLHLSYCLVSGSLLFFLLTQFLTGHWIL